MRDEQTATGLRCHWVPVTDASGRTRMEARWTTGIEIVTHAA